MGETNPLYVDPVAWQPPVRSGGILSRRRPSSPRFATRTMFSIRLPAFAGGGLMAGIDIELGAPIRAGDSIRVSSELKQTYEKTGRTGTMNFAVVRSTLTNQKGEVVAHVEHRMMRRAPRSP